MRKANTGITSATEFTTEMTLGHCGTGAWSRWWVPVWVYITMLVSVVGLWLGLITLVLYFILLLLGYLTGVLFVADAGLQRLRRPEPPAKGWMIGALAAVLVVLALLRLLPVVGALVAFALLLFGLGALTRALWRRYTSG